MQRPTFNEIIIICRTRFIRHRTRYRGISIRVAFIFRPYQKVSKTEYFSRQISLFEQNILLYMEMSMLSETLCTNSHRKLQFLLPISSRTHKRHDCTSYTYLQQTSDDIMLIQPYLQYNVMIWVQTLLQPLTTRRCSHKTVMFVNVNFIGDM